MREGRAATIQTICKLTFVRSITIIQRRVTRLLEMRKEYRSHKVVDWWQSTNYHVHIPDNITFLNMPASFRFSRFSCSSLMSLLRPKIHLFQSVARRWKNRFSFNLSSILIVHRAGDLSFIVCTGRQHGARQTHGSPGFHPAWKRPAEPVVNPLITFHWSCEGNPSPMA